MSPLPFLDKRKVAGLIIAKRKPDGSTEEMHTEGDENAPIMSCADDLISAVHAKDASGVAAAMRAAFEILDSEPPKEDSNDYDSQNTKAGENE